jgi:NAD/NADP transhydrogenase beta subunit
MVTFTGSFVAVLKLHETISTKPTIIPYRWITTVFMFVVMIVLSVFCFNAGQTWNDRGLGIALLTIVGVVAGLYGIVFVMAIGGGDMPCVICFLNRFVRPVFVSRAGMTRLSSHRQWLTSVAFHRCRSLVNV